MEVTTTAFYAALCALLLVPLSVNVVAGRQQFKVALGDGGLSEMARRVRAQANFLEYAPLFLIILAMAEWEGLWPMAVHVLAILFLAGRAMHAYSLLKAEKHFEGRFANRPIWRIYGMRLTLLSLTIAAFALLFLVLRSRF